MAFKKKPVVNARLDQMSKAQLIATVKTLRNREKKLLSQTQDLAERLREAHRELEAPAGACSGETRAERDMREAYSQATKAMPAFPWEADDEGSA